MPSTTRKFWACNACGQMNGIQNSACYSCGDPRTADETEFEPPPMPDGQTAGDQPAARPSSAADIRADLQSGLDKQKADLRN